MNDLNFNYGILAAAIIRSGKLENDLLFFESDWFQDLLELASISYSHFNKANTSFICFKQSW